MKLLSYGNDPLVRKLNGLSEAATPGKWVAEYSHHVLGTPLGMHWIKPPQADYQGVSMGTGNENDPKFVAALVNAWREGKLYVVMEA